MRSIPFRAFVAILLAAGILGVGALFWSDPLSDVPAPATPDTSADSSGVAVEKPQFQPRSHVGYIGSQVCRQCHSAICDEYSTHPMWHATRNVEDAASVETYGPDAAFVHAGETYVAERTDDAIRHRILRRSESGELLYEQSMPIDYVIGAGDRGRSYLVQQGELLFQSPLSWYAGSQGWDLSPGYVQVNHRFERRIVDGCVACHVGRIDGAADPPDRFATTQVLEGGVSCERCHGPAAAHVAWRQSDERGFGGDPIVRFDRLTPPQQEAVCLQCHLTGVDRVVRYGRSEFDFRPGDLLTDIWMPFIFRSDETDETPHAAVSHVEQLRSSRCVTEQGRSLGCTACHDPHGLPTTSERIEFYRDRCLTCHGKSTSTCSLPDEKRLGRQPDDSCIACHMPRLAADDVPHTALTDHRILRDPFAASGQSDQGGVPRIALTTEAKRETPAWEQQRAKGIMLIRRAQQSSDVLLAHRGLDQLRPLAPQLPDDLLYQEALAKALALTGAVGEARPVWEQILQQAPENEAALEGLAFSCHDAEQFDLALRYLDRLLAVNFFRSEYHGRRAHILGRLGRLPEAIESAQRAVEMNPSNLILYRWLAEACRTAGRTGLHRHYSRLADELEQAVDRHGPD